MKIDKDVCIVTVCMALALCGAGFLVPVRAARTTAGRTATASVSPQPAPIGNVSQGVPAISKVASADSGEDSLDDDSDLLGQWTDPKYMQEAHVQMGGILAMFVLTAGVWLVRRRQHYRKRSSSSV
jgi:hypothetical protein